MTGNLIRQLTFSHVGVIRGSSLKVDVLAGKVSVDGREGVELVLKQVLVFGVEEAEQVSTCLTMLYTSVSKTYTRMSFPPSWATRVLLPTISEGQTISSRIFSWTAVRVRERGRFCLPASEAFRLGLGRTRR